MLHLSTTVPLLVLSFSLLLWVFWVGGTEKLVLCHPAGQRSPLLRSWEISELLVFWANFPLCSSTGFVPHCLGDSESHRFGQLWGRGIPCLPLPSLSITGFYFQSGS